MRNAGVAVVGVRVCQGSGLGVRGCMDDYVCVYVAVGAIVYATRSLLTTLLCLCKWVWVRECMGVRVHVYLCMRLCMHTCMCACVCGVWCVSGVYGPYDCINTRRSGGRYTSPSC